MFKKTLAAAAVLGAFAGSAFAADVTVYGVIDAGVLYTHSKTDATGLVEGQYGWTDHEKTDSFTMESGTNSASRFGLRGTEDLGNGMKVGFKLENGFSVDSGELGEDRLFGREASLNVSGSFGTIYMGRMGTLVSDTGSVGFYGAMASAFGSGWSDNIPGHTAVMADYTSRLDNVITYVSPEFAGTTIYAQYAMGGDDGGAENKSNTDRYAALGAEWKAGAFDFGALVDWTNKSTDSGALVNDPNIEDAWTFNLAGSYDCGFAKTFLAVQYFKDSRDAAGILDSVGYFDKDWIYNGGSEASVKFNKAATSTSGYGVHLSTAFDALGGSWMAGIGYMDGDFDYATDGQIGDIKAYSASIGYEYALSKRTTLYTGAGYLKRELDLTATGTYEGNWEDEGYDVTMGLVHRF